MFTLRCLSVLPVFITALAECPRVCNAATVVFYNTAVAFDAAVTSTSVLDFDDGNYATDLTVFEPAGGVLDFDPVNGILVTSPISFGSFSLSIAGSNNTEDDTFFRPNGTTFANAIDAVDADDGILSLALFSGEHTAFTFSFNTPITAVGAALFSAEDPLDFLFNFQSGATAVASTASNDVFAGFAFDEAVTSFTISSAQDLTFRMGNFRVAAIPEPSSLLLLGVGTAIVVRRRRRLKSAG